MTTRLIANVDVTKEYEAFTPGPWEATRIGNDIEIGAETEHGHLSVAWIHMGEDRDPTQDEACVRDGQLVTAAPRLLVQRNALYEALKEMADTQGLCGEPTCRMCKLASNALKMVEEGRGE